MSCLSSQSNWETPLTVGRDCKQPFITDLIGNCQYNFHLLHPQGMQLPKGPLSTASKQAAKPGRFDPGLGFNSLFM